MEEAAAGGQGIADPVARRHPDQRAELPSHAFGHCTGGDDDRRAGGGILQGAQGREPLRIGQGGIGQQHLGPPAALGQHAQGLGQGGRDPQVEPAAESRWMASASTVFSSTTSTRKATISSGEPSIAGTRPAV